MNWIDGILIALLLAMVIVGSKKGLIRELMAFVVFFAAVIFSIMFIDNFAVWVYQRLGGSPLVSAILSFVILLALSYAVFKLAGIFFYKVANVKTLGKRDQMGGALIGFLRGWLAVSILTFMVLMLPMPESFYGSFESSFLGTTIARTVPALYDGTKAIHPNEPKFMTQMETTLLVAPGKTTKGSNMPSEQRQEAHRALYHLDRVINPVE